MFTPPQAILDNAESVILLKDKQRRYITVSRRFETLFKIGRTAGQAAPSGAGG